MRFRFLICLILVCSGIAPRADAQQLGSLEVFDDAGFTQRIGLMEPGLKTLYLRLLYPTIGPAGYTGLEFRLTGLEGFVVDNLTWTGSPNVVLGTLGNGINVAWPGCQGDELLLSFRLFSMHPPENRVIQVAAHTTPSNSNFNFPYLLNCDGPCIFCGAVVEGEPYILNPRIAVESTQWSHIKRLYQ